MSAPAWNLSKNTCEMKRIQFEHHFAWQGGRDAPSVSKNKLLEENTSHHVKFEYGNHLEQFPVILPHENLEIKHAYDHAFPHV